MCPPCARRMLEAALTDASRRGLIPAEDIALAKAENTVQLEQAWDDIAEIFGVQALDHTELA